MPNRCTRLPRGKLLAAIVLTALWSVSGLAQFTDLRPSTLWYPSDTAAKQTTAIAYDTAGGIWAIGATGAASHQGGFLKTTSDVANFTDRLFLIDWNESAIQAIRKDGTTWIFAGNGILKTTTDLVNFTERCTGPASLVCDVINAIGYDGTAWVFAGDLLRTTTNFVNFTDRTSAANLGATINDIALDGGTWGIIGPAGRLKTSTDLANFIDRTAGLNFGSNDAKAIATDGTTWAIGGAASVTLQYPDFLGFRGSRHVRCFWLRACRPSPRLFPSIPALGSFTRARSFAFSPIMTTLLCASTPPVFKMRSDAFARVSIIRWNASSSVAILARG